MAGTAWSRSSNRSRSHSHQEHIVARVLTIGSHTISDDTACYVIAEVGHNHQGKLKTCMDLFKAAKESGAHAVKLQKRHNRSLYTKAMYDRPYDNENSYGATYGEHREALEFGEMEYRELQQYCTALDVDFFATAFDFHSADFLHKLDMPAYKIASGDLRNIPLLRHVAQIGKPMIVSTGGGTLEDVRRAYETVMQYNQQLAILQCTAGYPCEYELLDLKVITTYREAFPSAVIGFSGHDNGIAMAVAAFVLGSRILEKHFTLNRAWKGTDHAFSLEPVGLRKMVRDLDRTMVALGDGQKKVHPSETSPIMKMGKKIVAARALPSGHLLGFEDLALKSPGDGLQPYEMDNVIGRSLIQPVSEDDEITFQMLKPTSELARL
ncbi:MAG: N-acetylneuraminate synthase family protein [Acidobacteria bacterium]|nr:N-acetylneuraminate synthase family protein [Acidobacteriota bacterium]